MSNEGHTRVSIESEGHTGIYSFATIIGHMGVARGCIFFLSLPWAFEFYGVVRIINHGPGLWPA